MGSPWETAIQQAMQRHGGSHRSIPKSVQSKLSVKKPHDGVAPAKAPQPEVPVSSEKPKSPAV